MKSRARKLLASVTLMVILLTACAGTVIVRPQYKPEKRPDASAPATPSATVLVTDFADRRPVRTASIGERKAAFDVSMGDVYIGRPVGEIVQDAVKAELVSGGYTVVHRNGDVTIGGEVRTFEMRTDVTTMYWDVVADISFVMSAETGEEAEPVELGPYTGHAVERTYVNPSESIVTSAVEKALAQAVGSVGSDAKLAELLGR